MSWMSHFSTYRFRKECFTAVVIVCTSQMLKGGKKEKKMKQLGISFKASIMIFGLIIQFKKITRMHCHWNPVIELMSCRESLYISMLPLYLMFLLH